MTGWDPAHSFSAESVVVGTNLQIRWPAPNMGEQVLLSIRLYLYGSNAADVVAREQPVWQAWLGEAFPSEQIPSDTSDREP